MSAPDLQDPRILGAKYEIVLTDLSVKYEYVEAFPIAKIRNREGSQIRIGQALVSEEKARTFVTLRQGGAVFPPSVLRQGPGETRWLIDGNHRVASAKGVKARTIPAYITQPLDDELANFVGAALNALEGDRLTAQQVEYHAEEAFRLGFSDDEIARRLGRNRGRIHQLRNEREFVDRLSASNGLILGGQRFEAAAAVQMITDGPRRLSRRYWQKLNRINNNPALTAATTLAWDVRLDNDTLADLVDVVNKARTEADAVKAIHSKREELQPIGGEGNQQIPSRSREGRGMAPAGEVFNAVRRLGKYQGRIPEILFDSSQPERREEFVTAWQVLGSILDAWSVNT